MLGQGPGGGMGAGAGRGGRLPLTADINVTSLVDVAFTLLVIFIITAPILQGGVEVQLPQAESAPITSSSGIIVTVARDGRVYLGEVPFTDLRELERAYPTYVREREASEVFLKGDRDVSYGRVLQVLGLLKRLDVAEVGLVAEQPPEEP